MVTRPPPVGWVAHFGENSYAPVVEESQCCIWCRVLRRVANGRSDELAINDDDGNLC